MNTTLLFDFSVDRENKTISITREFAANINLVWDAWTKPELLDLWWAPKPYQTKTKYMDFRVGGYWLYAMIGPDNTTHWSKAEFKEIEISKYFTGLDSFCDQDGNINMEFPRALWTNSFSQSGSRTTVKILSKYEDASDIEKIIQMGFREGISMAFGNLDQYFDSL